MAINTYAEFKILVPSGSSVTEARFDAYNAAAQKIAEAFCKRVFALSQTLTEYYNFPPPGQRAETVLNQFPVISLTSVNIDVNGGKGQIPNTFGTDTLLTTAEYYCDLAEGIVQYIQCRMSWPMTPYSGYTGQPFPYATDRRQQPGGEIKVVYVYGFGSEYPADLKLAVAELTAWMASGAIDLGGREISSFIDVSATSEQLTYASVPALASARAILATYKDKCISRGRW